jgi:hypothetical protein
VRVLGSAVLGLEAIVVILLIPVAVTVGLVSGPPWLFISAGIALVIALIITAGYVTRPWAIWAGWILQGLIIATAITVPAMILVGGIFAGLWALAIRWGRRADALRHEGPVPD